jgi:hypothetical protein
MINIINFFIIKNLIISNILYFLIIFKNNNLIIMYLVIFNIHFINVILRININAIISKINSFKVIKYLFKSII